MVEIFDKVKQLLGMGQEEQQEALELVSSTEFKGMVRTLSKIRVHPKESKRRTTLIELMRLLGDRLKDEETIASDIDSLMRARADDSFVARKKRAEMRAKASTKAMLLKVLGKLKAWKYARDNQTYPQIQDCSAEILKRVGLQLSIGGEALQELD